MYPYLVIRESDSKLYTNFEYCEKKIINIIIIIKHFDLQSQAIYNDEKNSKRSLNILEDGASG